MMTTVLSGNPLRVETGVITLSGYGLRITVERGHLVLEDGIAGTRRSRRLPRVSPNVHRMVILGHTGTVSFDAIRWMHDVGIAFMHIDADAQLLAVGGGPTFDDAQVRRGQALAPWNATGLAIACELLSSKVRGQAAVLDTVPGQGRVAAGLLEIAERMSDERTVHGLRYLESRAALAYWDGWATLAVPFARRDAAAVPSHWLLAGPRSSVLSNGPRKAITPAHAILNYLYAILEAEARLACLALGLDPALGLVHSDNRTRHSLVLDLMEPVRPHVDAYVLELLRTKTFLRSDFFETRDGTCRVMPSLTEPLARTALHWRDRIGPVVEQVAALCAAGIQDLRSRGTRSETPAVVSGRYRTPLTRANRRRPLKVKRLTAVQERAALRALAPARCSECGSQVPTANRKLCDACLPAHAERASKAAAQARLRHAVGERDKRSSEEARAKHRSASIRQGERQRAWKAAHPVTPNPQQFTAEIWPHIRNRTVPELMAASGLSRPLCRNILRGKAVPHPMHWDAFRKLVRSGKQARASQS